MPPYKAVVSDAQRRKLFALAGEGKLSLAEARGKARAAKGRDLPEHVGSARPSMRALHAHSHR
jgi:hypothetical protein